jgi:hypothetical protein
MVELVSFLFNRLNDDLLSLTVTVFHSIWLRRNKLIFEEQFSSPMMVFKEASKFFEDFRMFNLREPLLRVLAVEGSNGGKLWKFPEAGFMKVNWDASLNLKAGVVGLGYVIRNEDGFVVDGYMVQVDPLLAEAMTAFFALDFFFEMGLTNILSEGDSL